MNYRKIQKKIKTIGNVKKITKAMEMISAIKMKKSQQSALETAYYTTTLEDMLGRVINSYDLEKQQIIWSASDNQVKNDLYILISSSKGLCGSFNFNLFKLLVGKVNIDNSIFITVGKKGFDFINRLGGKIEADFSNKQPVINSASAIFNIAAENFITKKSSRIFLVYNKFISTFVSQPTISQLLPLISLKELVDEKSQLVEQKYDYIIEPLNMKIINEIISDLLVQKVRKSIIDSTAAEFASRMMAMKNANDNANQIIYDMTLVANKLRQSAITSELLEMTAAKESSEV